MVEGDAIETERLFIRRFTPDDAEEFLPLVSLPDVLRHTGEQPFSSPSEVTELLKTHQLRDYELYGYGRMACIEKATGRLIGFSGLKYLDDMDETDVGYRFLPDTWGKGYATESAAAIMEAQTATFALSRAIGLVAPENRGSVRVLRKLGFAYERRILSGSNGKLEVYAIHV